MSYYQGPPSYNRGPPPFRGGYAPRGRGGFMGGPRGPPPFASPRGTRNPRKVYVANVSSECTEHDLHSLFSSVGTISLIEFKGDFAFVEYQQDTAAERAIAYVFCLVFYLYFVLFGAQIFCFY